MADLNSAKCLMVPDGKLFAVVKTNRCTNSKRWYREQGLRERGRERETGGQKDGQTESPFYRLPIGAFLRLIEIITVLLFLVEIFQTRNKNNTLFLFHLLNKYRVIWALDELERSQISVPPLNLFDPDTNTEGRELLVEHETNLQEGLSK